jgi:putative PIN family toxin of toxin-antitoxin system
MRSIPTRRSRSPTPSCGTSAPSGTRLRRRCAESSSTRGVLVSALITPLGPPAEIVRAIRAGRLTLVVSPHLLAELLGVLQREKFRLDVTIEEVEQYVAGLASHAESIPDPPDPEQIARDPNDDYLIALARGAGADLIVSGDADLLVLDEVEPSIVSASRLVAEFIRESP